MTTGDGSAAALDPELTRDGPLDPQTADRLLARGDQLLASADFQLAARYYQRLVGATPDPAHTAAALYGLGMALYRLDADDDALDTWEQILRLPETPTTYRAWREVAAARVRKGDLPGAQKAYREAQRRAPNEDRPEIASRLGWLAKETGDAGAANRYFARSRGGAFAPYLTYAIIGITAVISVLAFDPRSELLQQLDLDKFKLAQGEYWRLFTVTLLHGSYLHLFFNMYALFLAGALVEQLYGPRWYLALYLISAAAGSLGSFLFGGDVPSVGASGAIFGLFGVLLAVSRTHHPVLDRRGQMLIGQIGGLIVINLLLGFGIAGIGGGIDNAAHVGGLIAGLWLGFLLIPGRVPTLCSLWQRPAGTGDLVSRPGGNLLRMLGVLALIVVIGVGVVIGQGQRHVPVRTRGSVDGGRTAIVITVDRG